MHPQARAFLDGPVRAQRFPPSEELQDPERLYAYLNSIRGHVELPESPIPVSQVDQETAFTVPVRVYHGDAPSAVIVYMHGGGWVAGDLNTHDAVCRYLARHTPAVVVNVDYRLAPETPYPVRWTTPSARSAGRRSAPPTGESPPDGWWWRGAALAATWPQRLPCTHATPAGPR